MVGETRIGLGLSSPNISNNSPENVKTLEDSLSRAEAGGFPTDRLS